LGVSLAIVVLMVAVGFSFRQLIRAYPHGGGSYVVAHQNLGELPALIAAAGLLIDYMLKVAVSISRGSRRSPPRSPVWTAIPFPWASA
jgi:amino acid transporter